MPPKKIIIHDLRFVNFKTALASIDDDQSKRTNVRSGRSPGDALSS